MSSKGTDDLAISVRGLSKAYTIAHEHERPDTLTQAVLRRVRRPFARPQTETFWALRDLSFEVKRGEVVGVIGHNGAGKSTLLKVLSRITEPTQGEIDLYGRVGSLLEVGTGFHPELTGRENIFLNGAILGMTKAEIRAQFDAIVDFAGVERFLDTPVKRYSSGMYVRLAFAVAAHLNPEILIVDEVLAVGDAEFQAKCLGKMKEVGREGRTVLFVSHQLNAVQSLCTSCLLLAKGQVKASGKPAAVIAEYLSAGAAAAEWRNSGRQYENPYFKPTRLALVGETLQPLRRDLQGDERAGVLIEGDVTTADDALSVGFAVYASEGQLLYWSLHTDTAREQWPTVRVGPNRLVGWLPRRFLNEGEYRVELHTSLHWREWLCQPGVNSPSIQIKVRGGLSDSPLWMEARQGLLAPVLPFEAVPVQG